MYSEGFTESEVDLLFIKVQQGREPVDVDFCSITIDGTLDQDLLQQQIDDVSRQREELQHMEIELKAQMIATSEIIELQNNFDAQIKDHANAAAKLQVFVDNWIVLYNVYFDRGFSNFNYKNLIRRDDYRSYASMLIVIL